MRIREQRDRLIAGGFAIAVALAAIAPIRNYDFFWHLATGRWIIEHRAFPGSDPFAVASDTHTWINGEWLFEVAVHVLHSLVGLSGLSFVRGLFTALLFTSIFILTRRMGEDTAGSSRSAVALLLTAIAFAGAAATLDVRPASVAMLFVVVALVSRTALAHALLAIVWINVHPSALLAPGIAALTTRRVVPAIASGAALLINPFGWRAILAPIELLGYVRSGTFVNAEWLPSPPTVFPLLYLSVAIGVAALATGFAQSSGRPARLEQLSRALLFALFAYLAIRHVRNQGLFFAAFPLLVMPAVARWRIRSSVAYAASAVAVVLVGLTTDHRLGVAPERFPVHATARLRAAALPGNIYNPDQFGGWIIWSFYPERRTLTDGRNELYRTFIPEYAEARLDQRAWRRLLAKYRIDLAIDEFSAPLQVIDGITGEKSTMPASLAYWPRNQWALIAFDDAAMIFARRAAFSPETIERWEIPGVVPDAISPARAP
jgi:hypothetical protein